MSASDTGLCSSATIPSVCELEVKPMVATLDVYTTRRTPCFRAASSNERVPSTFERYISLGIAHPQPVVRRNVKYDVAAGKRLLNRSRVAQVAGHPLRIQALNVAQIAGRPHQQPQLGSLFRQNARNMTAQKSGSAGNESQHLALSSQLSALSHARTEPSKRLMTDGFAES